MIMLIFDLDHDYDNDGDDADDHLSVNGHTEIPDKSSGSTSRSAPRCCQVQSTLIIIEITLMIMMVLMMVVISSTPFRSF